MHAQKRLKVARDNAFKVPRVPDKHSLTFARSHAKEEAMPALFGAADMTTIEGHETFVADSVSAETLAEMALGPAALQDQHSLNLKGLPTNNPTLVPSRLSIPHPLQNSPCPTPAMVMWTDNFEGNAAL